MSVFLEPYVVIPIGLVLLSLYLYFNGTFAKMNDSKARKPVQSVPGALPVASIPGIGDKNTVKKRSLGIPKDQLMVLPTEPVKKCTDRRISPEMLSQCCLDGNALWLACYSKADKQVVVFDVTSRADFYGVDGGYCMLAGRDASYQLGAMALGPEDLKLYDISGLTAKQETTLLQWFSKFKEKYPVMGYLWPHQTGLKLRDPQQEPVEEEEEELPYVDQTKQANKGEKE